MELFKLFGTIAVDNSGANKAIDETTSKAKSAQAKIATAFTKAGDTMSGIGKKLLPVSTAVGGLGIATGKMAMDFEDSMADINTLLDDDSHLKGYEKSVKSISKETGLSIENMADGMYQAISSIGDGGEETQKIFNTMAVAAKAGSAEVSDSVSLISAGMKGYNQVNQETAQRISDLAFQTAKLGVTTFPEMAKSMQPLFPLANSLNLSYEDLFGSMATLTGVTGNTAEVSTQLKAVFSNLMKPTGDMQTLIEKYGYSSGQAMLESEGFAGMLKIVQQETGGQADKMASLFSSTEAVTAMTALTGSQFDTFNSKLAQMSSATGATNTAYEKLNTSGDKMRKAWNNLKVTGLELGQTLITTLAPIIETVAEKVGKFSEWFSSLNEGQRETIVKIAAMVAAAGPLLIMFGKVTSGIGSIISIGGKLFGGIGNLVKISSTVLGTGSKVAGGIASLGTKIGGALIPAIAAIPAPVWIVIAVIGALVAAGIALYKNWDEVSAWAKKAWGAIKETVKNAIDGVVGFFQNVIDFVKDNWQSLLLFLVNPIVGGFKLIYDNCTGFREFIDNFLAGIKDVFSNMVENIKQKATDLKDSVIQKFSDLKENTVNKMEELKEKAVNKFIELKEKSYAKVEELKEKAVNKFEELKVKTTGKIEELKDKALSKVEELKEKAVNKFNDLKEKATNKLQNLKDQGLNKINELKEKGITGLTDLASKGLERFDKLKDGIKDKLEAVKNFVSGTVDKLKSFFSFDWDLPKIKLPHFSIDGEFSLNPPSIPHLDVEWYKNGGIMTQPTAFGFNPMTGKVMGGGEAGAEAIAPISLLQEYIKTAVQENNQGLMTLMSKILNLLNQYLPCMTQMKLVLDSGETIGALAPGLNSKLGSISNFDERIR